MYLTCKERSCNTKKNKTKRFSKNKKLPLDKTTKMWYNVYILIK